MPEVKLCRRLARSPSLEPTASRKSKRKRRGYGLSGKLEPKNRQSIMRNFNVTSQSYKRSQQIKPLSKMILFAKPNSVRAFKSLARRSESRRVLTRRMLSQLLERIKNFAMAMASMMMRHRFPRHLNYLFGQSLLLRKLVSKGSERPWRTALSSHYSSVNRIRNNPLTRRKTNLTSCHLKMYSSSMIMSLRNSRPQWKSSAMKDSR